MEMFVIALNSIQTDSCVKEVTVKLSISVKMFRQMDKYIGSAMYWEKAVK